MNATPTIEQVPAADWQTWSSDNDAVILDIREPFEWTQGTLPGSETVQMMALPARLAELDPSTPLLIVCRSGNRSLMVAQYLASNGFEKVANLFGGLKALGMAT